MKGTIWMKQHEALLITQSLVSTLPKWCSSDAACGPQSDQEKSQRTNQPEPKKPRRGNPVIGSPPGNYQILIGAGWGLRAS